MAEETLRESKPLKKRADDFLMFWHRFPIDYWWRKKYNAPFGSSKHREMSLIDMFIEYKEEVNLLAEQRKEEVVEEVDQNVIPMSQSEIDDDYENLDLSEFDKK